MSERKTTRVVGAVVRAIRQKAKHGDPFRLKEIPGSVGHRGYRRMVGLMVQKVELRRIKQGGGQTESIYQIA